MKQISIFLENKPGQLSHISDFLGKEGINIRAISVVDTSDFGVVRIVCDDTEKALLVLRSSNFTVYESDVIAVEVPDHPGGLASLLKPLSEEKINVEYLYTSLSHQGENAILLLKVNDIEKAVNILKKNWFKVIEGDSLL